MRLLDRFRRRRPSQHLAREMAEAAESYGSCAACGDVGRLVRRRLCWTCLLTLTRLQAWRLSPEEQARIDRRVAEVGR